MITKMRTQLEVAKTIYDQQTEMATTRGRRVANRIVSFSQASVRPIIRGKAGKPVELIANNLHRAAFLA
jgi:hypothetical protein